MLHIKKIKPLFNNLVTTGDKYEEDMIDNGIIVAAKGSLKLYQKVIAVGSTVRDINVGDQVMINPINYVVRKYSKDSLQNDIDNNPVLRYNFNWVLMEDKDGKQMECLLLNDRDIMYSFVGFETNESVLVPEKKIIL